MSNDNKDWSKPDSYTNDNVEHQPDAQELAAAKRVFGDDDADFDAGTGGASLTPHSSGEAFDRINSLRLKVEAALEGSDVVDAIQALSVSLAHGLTFMTNPCSDLANKVVPLIHVNLHAFLAADGRMEGANGKKLDS